MSLVRRFAFSCLFCALLAASPAWAKDKAKTHDAEKVVQSFYTALVSVMKDGPTLGFDGRYKKLDPVIRKAFNLPVMARIASGSGWATATPDQKDALVEAFSAFSIATYANRFDSFDGEEFIVKKENIAETGIIVETVLQPKTGEPVILNYLMRQDKNGAFRIVDVFMNGTISELATRRSAFASIVRKEGFASLTQHLENKADSLRIR